MKDKKIKYFKNINLKKKKKVERRIHRSTYYTMGKGVKALKKWKYISIEFLIFEPTSLHYPYKERKWNLG